MADGPLRVGLVGLGKIAQLHHLPNLVASPDFELVGMCDLSRTLGVALARRHALDSVVLTTEVSELLDLGLDAVVIANRDHLPVLQLALDKGVVSLVEKPACWSIDELRQVSSHPRAERVMVGYMKLHDPSVRAFHDVVAAEADQPTWLRVHNFAGGRHKMTMDGVVRDPAASRAAKDEYAGIRRSLEPGIRDDDDQFALYQLLMELAIHDINLVHRLESDLTLHHARARRTESGLALAVDASAGPTTVTMEFLPDFASKETWDETITAYGRNYRHHLRFDSPFLSTVGAELMTLRASEEAVSTTTRTAPGPNAFAMQVEALRDLCRGRSVPGSTLHEAERDHEFIADVVAHAVWS